MPKENAAPTQTNSAINGLEARLWAAADALRNNMERRRVQARPIGLIFLKYISDRRPFDLRPGIAHINSKRTAYIAFHSLNYTRTFL